MNTCNTCVPTLPSVPRPPAFPAFPPPTGGGSSSSGGSSGGGTGNGGTVVTCPDYISSRVTAQTFTMVAKGSQGQMYSQCAYLWVAPGATLFLSPFGVVSVLGVTGDLITFENKTVMANTVLNAGTMLIQGLPIAEQSGAIEASDIDRLLGFDEGVQSYIVGQPNQLLRWETVGSRTVLRPVAGMIFIPNASNSVELSPENAGGGSITTTPLPGPGTGLEAYYTLPNIPTNRPPNFWVRLRIRISATTAKTAIANAVTVSHGGVELSSMIDTKVMNTEVSIPVNSSRIQLTIAKGNADTNVYVRVRVLGYYI